MQVIIVGAGFGGLAAAIELRRHGFTEVTILEAGPELGGTWFYNGYPGAACDVPSHLYSLSYAQRGDWSRFCSPRSEILDYLREVAREHGLGPTIATDSVVTSCRWDEQTCRWAVRTRASPAPDPASEPRVRYADAVVLATGQLNQPAIPAIEGLTEFTGRMFHSARWEHDYSLRGKRVAVVGTGASAVQFVPEIAEQAAALTVFGRTANWFLPRRNRPYPGWAKALLTRSGWARRVWRALLFGYLETLTAAIRHPETVGRLYGLAAAAFMRRQLPDQRLRRKAWPDYPFGCKRVLFSSSFLPALARPNVELVTEAITRMSPDGPVTADGRTHRVDCVIFGTGFKTHDFMFPMEITGVGGRSLREEWADGPHAHLGITVPGFPSLFVLYGPNTNTSGGSIVFFLEQQVGYLRQALQHTQRRTAAAIEIRREVERRSDRAVQAGFAGTAWLRCNSWYRNRAGRVIANWPGYMTQYRRLTRRLDPAQFALRYRSVAGDGPPGANGPERPGAPADGGG